MNKKLLFVGALLALSLNSYSKEIVAAPVVVEEPVVEAPAPVRLPEWILSTRVGADLWAEYNGGENDYDVDDMGYEVGLELLRQLNADSNWYFGLGALYQAHGETEDYGGVGYDSVPVYATAKYKFYEYNDFDFYGKANLGYSFNFNEESGDVNAHNVHDGMYWAAGLGAEYRNFFMDLMYQQNLATLGYGNEGGIVHDRDDFDYERVTLGAGYNFDLPYWF